MSEATPMLPGLSPLQGLDPLLQHMEILGSPMFEDGWATLQVRLKDFHMNGGGNTHGGVVMTLLDVAMACSTSVQKKGKTCVTVEMKANFLRPAGRPGDLLRARGKMRSGGNSLAFCEAEVLNEAGEVLATASGTFKYLSSIGKVNLT
jgi:uncharacterized protein (TIGR00369 family)